MRKIKTGKPLSERESESLTTYLDEIGRAKLLSEEEERELSEKIKNGDTRALDKLSRNGLSLDSLMSMLPRRIRNMVR